MARAAKAPPDGYTVSLCTIGTCAINPSIYSNPGYDLKKDFAPVFMVGGVMNIFTVHPSVPVKTIKEFVAHAKANPGKIATAIGGIGSSNHLTPVWFANVAGINLLYVPFKGSGDSITALPRRRSLRVRRQRAFDPAARPERARARARGDRTEALENLPDVPTMIESGYKGFVVEPWFGFQVPAGHAAGGHSDAQRRVQRVGAEPTIKKRLEEAGLRIVGGPPERLGEQITSEYDALGEGGEGQQHQGGLRREETVSPHPSLSRFGAGRHLPINVDNIIGGLRGPADHHRSAIGTDSGRHALRQ